MKLTAGVLAGLMLAGGGVIAWDYWPRPRAQAAGQVSFKRASPDSKIPPLFDIQIDGKKATVPKAGEKFPASFWADNGCSSTLIGDQVLLTARHCVSNPNVTI